jgi:hypothetical protein
MSEICYKTHPLLSLGSGYSDKKDENVRFDESRTIIFS